MKLEYHIENNINLLLFYHILSENINLLAITCWKKKKIFRAHFDSDYALLEYK